MSITIWVTFFRVQGKLEKAIEAFKKAISSSLIMLRLIITWALLSKIQGQARKGNRGLQQRL